MVRGQVRPGCYNDAFVGVRAPMTKRTVPVSLLSLCLLLLCACATLPPGTKRDPRDPWEKVNRSIYHFNDKLDKAVLRPAARGYVKITPRFVRTGIRNALDNLNYPVVMLNDLLQGQVHAFLNDTSRLVLNTTLGIGGLFDPATAAGLDKNDREFGQTLGKWGVPKGPFLELPFFGASDVRDAFGKVVNDFSSPRQYIKNDYVNYGLFVIDEVDTRSRLLSLDPLVDSAYDPYAFIRNAYLQNRDFKVSGGSAQSEEDRQEELLEKQADEDQAADSVKTPSPASPPASPPAQTTPPQNPPPH
jgi:phospholipid-binding lipoprotein MlaA